VIWQEISEVKLIYCCCDFIDAFVVCP